MGSNIFVDLVSRHSIFFKKKFKSNIFLKIGFELYNVQYFPNVMELHVLKLLLIFQKIN